MNQQLLTYADAVIHLITELDLDGTIAAAMPATWEQGSRLLQSADACDQALGARLILTALSSTPGASQQLMEALTRKLAGHA